MEIINIEIIPRLVKRFLLSAVAYVPNPFGLARTVQPITNFDDLLQESKAGKETKDISGAVGEVNYFTVPVGKRWKLYALNRDATTVNSVVYITIGSTIYEHAYGTALSEKNFGHPFYLEEGDTIGMEDNGADAAVTMTIAYLEENSFRA